MFRSQRSTDSGDEVLMSLKKETERVKSRKQSRDHKEKEKEIDTEGKKEKGKENIEKNEKTEKRENRERKDSTDKNEKKEKKESKEGRDGKVESSDDDNLKDFGSEFEDLARGLDQHNLIMKEMQFMMIKIIEQVRTHLLLSSSPIIFVLLDFIFFIFFLFACASYYFFEYLLFCVFLF